MIYDTAPIWLPVVFAFLMGLSILIYVMLDGYDLGVGILTANVEDKDKDTMIASIGPFWDANETWLVLAVGLLLVAFPIAHGIILTALYIPVFVMLVGLILRGVAFEFRAKASPEKKYIWNWSFFAGSFMTALSQGFMLGMYIMGLTWTFTHILFSLLIALCLAAAYVLIGSCWLILKTSGDLQKKAIAWAQSSLLFTALGMAAVSLATPIMSERIFSKWFAIPEILLLAPLPLFSGVVFLTIYIVLKKMPFKDDDFAWLPYALTVCLFTFGFFGLAYSFYPYVVPDKLTIYEAAAAPESLAIILAGTLVVLPTIIGYTIFAYIVFRGKATALKYN